MNIGKLINEKRLEMLITQSELGRMLGVTQEYISAVERGAKEPTFTRGCQIAEALGTTPDALFREFQERSGRSGV